jgi:hypothetical protein
MLSYNPERVREAVQYLVDTSYFQHHLRKIRSNLPKPRAMPFKGETEVLNELLVVGRQSAKALENLIELAEFKRQDSKGNYQARFMAAKRERERKIIALEQILQKKRLSLDERRAAIIKHSEQFKQDKEAHIQTSQAAYIAEFGDEPGWKEKQQFIKEFWALKDMELDMMVEEAKRMMPMTERKVKRVVKVEPPKQGTPEHKQMVGRVGVALLKAIDRK